MRGNTIRINLEKKTLNQAEESLYQGDYGQRLIIEGLDLPSIYTVHFGNSATGENKAMVGDETGVDIPDEYLATGEPVHVWVFLHAGEDDGETERHGIIKVIAKGETVNEPPTPAQQSALDTAITALESGVTAAQEAQAAAEAAKTAAEGAAAHYPYVDSTTGNWMVWDGNTGAFIDTGYKAVGTDGQPGVGITNIEKTSTSGLVDTYTITFSNGNNTTFTVTNGSNGLDGQDATPALITVNYSDLTFPVAKDTQCYHDGLLYYAKQDIQTSEAWTAAHWQQTTVEEQQRLLLNAIQGKYTLPSGGIPDTDLSSGVQTSLGLANTAYQKPSGGIPALDIAEGVIPTVPTVATQAQIKGGTDDQHPIAPIYQHESVFYALAKLAGADMASLSPVTVGQFPDAQKTAIQKMLGIYESPWELIREDTVTNATEADVEITVDGNGESFELTDVYLQVLTPQQETNASIGDYGSVRSYYNDNNSIGSQMGTWTQSANTSAKYGQILLTNENGAIRNEATQNATQYTLVNLTSRTNIISDDALLKIGTYSFKKITIKKVTGTMKYKLYGRRKWN